MNRNFSFACGTVSCHKSHNNSSSRLLLGLLQCFSNHVACVTAVKPELYQHLQQEQTDFGSIRLRSTGLPNRLST
uniref:Secreted protein n=1 Tax=Echinococcus granulosus TaxID=6210 RepID=A0A068WL52_ECHGR|nr:hypothetical protein EgrG_000516200 [Echinococcus granulosus]